MSTRPDQTHATDRCPIHPRQTDRGRYVALGTTDDQVVVFDCEVDTAWVKSDNAIELESME